MKIRIVKGTTKISSKGDIVFHTFGGDMECRVGVKQFQSILQKTRESRIWIFLISKT